MLEMTRVEHHIAKAHRLSDEADKVIAEASAFAVAGEPDDEGNYPGNSEEGLRLLRIHRRLIERANKHALKAARILERQNVQVG